MFDSEMGYVGEVSWKHLVALEKKELLVLNIVVGCIIREHWSLLNELPRKNLEQLRQ